jgi:dCTP deaminase
MIYSDADIRNRLESGQLIIDPNPSRALFSTSSVDLRLGNRFTVFEPAPEGSEITIRVDQANPEEIANRYGREVTLEQYQYLSVHPGQFILAYTLEQISLPLDLAARVEGKSSLARLGLSVHQTAPTVQAGWGSPRRLPLRLEIANVGPFVCRLAPGIQICQLIFEELKTESDRELRSRFQNPHPNQTL